jgi:hypothetical protein
MILDDHLVLFDNAAITASGQISDVIDRGADAPTLAAFGPGYAGTPLYLVLLVGTAFNGNSGAFTGTIISLVSDSTADMNTSRTTHLSILRSVAELSVANSVVAVLQVPPGNYERYIGLRCANSGSTGVPSAGTLRGFLTTTPAQWQAMAANNPRAWIAPAESVSGS